MENLTLNVNDLPNICQINEGKTIKQSTYCYCSAACIKMCLDLDLSQEEIFSVLKEETIDQENWYAAPDAVYKFLSKYKQFLRTSDISESSIDATEWILSSMIQYQTKAPMLVLGGKHWVLYSGYQINHEGTPKGIYIRDPWPTTSSISFYPFSEYFFDEYFCNINVDGQWKNKVESFISSKIKKCVNIEKIQTSRNRKVNNMTDISFLKKDIIYDDLTSYGFSDFCMVKNGGLINENCIISDTKNKPKFLLTYAEIEKSLTILAIDIESNSVISFLKVNNGHFDLFNKLKIKRKLLSIHGIDVAKDNISFVYDKNFSSSCFDPIIKIKDVGIFNLTLQKYQIYN